MTPNPSPTNNSIQSTFDEEALRQMIALQLIGVKTKAATGIETLDAIMSAIQPVIANELKAIKKIAGNNGDYRTEQACIDRLAALSPKQKTEEA